MGRRPNLQRRQRAVQLRGEGLSLAEIGRRLGVSKQRAAHRIAVGLSQAELADHSGVPAGTIRGYQQGAIAPTWRPLGRLVRVLGPGLIVAEESP